jgi:hypothetical protein
MTRIAAASLLCSACYANVVRGSGRTVHQTREVPAFEGVSVAQGIHATVEIGRQGPIEIEGDENLISMVETGVSDGRLEIRFARRVSVWDGGDINVKVSAPVIRFLGASGGAEIRAELERVEELEMAASGGAEIHARGIDAAEVSAEGSGGAELDLAGRTEKLFLRMSGGTHVKAARLSTRSVRVSGSGGAHAEIRASDTIRGELSGGSDVHLIGNASSRVATSGGSSVDYDD